MAVILFCDRPEELLSNIKAAVRDGTITTWQMDTDGDFTHVPEQWKNKAWLRPVVQNGQLIFNILGQKRQKMSVAVYAVYHGRFIEMLLTHFDKMFTQSSATARPTDGDRLGGQAA